MSIPFSIQDIISRDEATNDLDNVTVCARVAATCMRADFADERTDVTDWSNILVFLSVRSKTYFSGRNSINWELK